MKKGFARLTEVERGYKPLPWDWIVVVVCAVLVFALGTCAMGCAANRVAFSESHWYPDGAPKSVVTLNQMQLVTAGSKLQEGANTFTRLDDQSIESGNASSGLDAGGDPVELLQAAVPLLALLDPTTAVTTAAPRADSMGRLIEILRVLRGTK